MAIKLGHDKGQRANICGVTSSLASDYMRIDLFCLIDVATGADLRKLKCEVRMKNNLPIASFEINFIKFYLSIMSIDCNQKCYQDGT